MWASLRTLEAGLGSVVGVGPAGSVVAPPLVQKRLGGFPQMLLWHGLGALGDDELHRGEDPAHEIEALGGDILVARIQQRLYGELHRFVAIDAGVVPLLQRVARVLPAGARRVVVEFLVPPADGVVLVDAPFALAAVVAREDRHDDQPLHRGG